MGLLRFNSATVYSVGIIAKVNESGFSQLAANALFPKNITKNIGTPINSSIDFLSIHFPFSIDLN